MADVNTGTAGLLRVTGSVVGSSAAGLWWDVAWTLQLIERVSAGSTRSFNPSGAYVDVQGQGRVWTGTYTFDWRPSGLQSQTIASGTTRVSAASNGSGSGRGNVTGHIAASGTSGAGGPTTLTQSVSLPTLTVLPGVPTGVSGSRVSDSSVSVSWSQSSASNGQPTSNTIRRRINGGAWTTAVTISPATSSSLSAAANQKLEYEVRAANAAGSTAFSSTSTAIYTTPAAPTGVSASKDADLDITVVWTPNVAYVEHEHVVEHGTVSDGVTTWDDSALATVAAGTSLYKHVDPDAGDIHVYRVSAVTTSAPALTSTTALSNTVQLLAAPNKPTLPVLPSFANRAAAFVLTWAHNPVDTTPQTAFEVNFSTNGGSTWTSTNKVTSGVSSRTITAGTYAANAAVTMRVRTWGEATSGGAESTGASPWSDQATVTFKTRPVVTVTSPVNAVDYVAATLNVQLGFSQAESATFVTATIELFEGATLLESVISTTRASTILDTRVADGVTYTVKVSVTDSNGLTSTQVSRQFDVAYTEPVPAGVTVEYLPDSGVAQIGLTFATAGAGQVAATTVTILRTIDGVTETVASRFPIAGASLTILDTTPTIHGVNSYRVRTFSEDGATADVVASLTTTEGDWAFLSSGDGFSNIIKFRSNLRVGAAASREQALVTAAGRESPIALFGPAKSLEVSGTATLFPGDESTPEEVEAFIRSATLVCYRDGNGRRIVGVMSASTPAISPLQSTFDFRVTEAT